MIIKLTAKCSDMCHLRLVDGEGKQVGETDGYVPHWLPNPNAEHYGDYVQLEIDVATGKILNWKKPTQTDLKETFKPLTAAKKSV